jgi:hypothetical protein
MNRPNVSRRDWLFRLGASGLLTLAALPCAQAEDTDPRDEGAGRSVSTEQLGEMLQPHFPVSYPVPGFLTLSVRTPRLAMRPETNRVDADMDVTAQGPALHRIQSGRLAVGFALRYEASDRTIRAHQLRVNSLSFPGLKPEAEALIRVYGPALAESALQEVVLHQMKDKDLAVLDVLGLRPGKIRVTETGLRIGFEPKPL